MKTLAITVILMMATPAAAEQVRWSDGKNVALVDGDQFRWETLHSSDTFSEHAVSYVGGTDWAEYEFQPRANNVIYASVIWQLEDIQPHEAIDDYGTTWHADSGEEGPFAMWFGLQWMRDGTLEVGGFRHWSANYGIGGITRMDSVSLSLYQVPEPSTLALVAVGLVGIWGFSRKSIARRHQRG